MKKLAEKTGGWKKKLGKETKVLFTVSLQNEVSNNFMQETPWGALNARKESRLDKTGFTGTAVYLSIIYVRIACFAH